jgi:hypothetical protein
MIWLGRAWVIVGSLLRYSQRVGDGGHTRMQDIYDKKYVWVSDTTWQGVGNCGYQ